METIFDEIGKICFDTTNEIDFYPYNRYMVVYRNMDRTKTAFCFGVPILKEKAKQIVDLTFSHNKFDSRYWGSSAEIIVTDFIRMKNGYGSCQIPLFGKIAKKTKDIIFCDLLDRCGEIRPTFNGLFFKVPCFMSRAFTVRIKIDQRFESVWSNDKCFAIMYSQFIPFITISCIGTFNDRDKVIAPCTVDCEKVNDKEYILTFKHQSRYGKYLAYEINMSEPKLFQDTTVESRHSSINNAFGGTAFLGETDSFGEQWLYSRLDYSNLTELHNKNIIKAVLHIPKLDSGNCQLIVNRLDKRFCSFGSNWNNKIPMSDQSVESLTSNGYYHIDITPFVASKGMNIENFVVRAKQNKSKKTVISTGDSFYKPQILEITFQ